MLNLGASLLAALYVLLFSTPSWAKIDNCEGYLGPTPISAEALVALHEAREHFEFRLLSKTVQGRPRLVILAGETHTKSKEANDRGLNLLDQFPLRGLEGANLDSGLTSRVLGWLLRAMEYVSIKGVGQSGSTIHDAYTIPAGRQEETSNLRLEIGHKFSLREKLSMAQTIAALGLPCLMLVTDFFARNSSADYAFTALTFINGLYLFGQVQLGKKYNSKPWFSVLFPLHDGLIEERNQTMTAAIEKGLIEYPDYDHMLVLIGRDHVPGMEQFLVDQYGFSQVDFPMP